MKNVDELMKPRYELIFTPPLCDSKKGDIVYGLGDSYSTHRSQVDVLCSAYPEIYRPLSWWEHRKPEEMPEYVKETVLADFGNTKKGKVCFYKIIEWDDITGNTDNIEEYVVLGLPYIEAIPTTEQEYLNYLKTIKPPIDLL